jgi:hypothetical protein
MRPLRHWKLLLGICLVLTGLGVLGALSRPHTPDSRGWSCTRVYPANMSPQVVHHACYRSGRS